MVAMCFGTGCGRLGTVQWVLRGIASTFRTVSPSALTSNIGMTLVILRIYRDTHPAKRMTNQWVAQTAD
jgi:hypothetical protein